MSYQRGTDLRHCPDGCEFYKSDSNVVWSDIYDRYMEFSGTVCLAKPTDICPREQAEKVTVACGYNIDGLMCGLQGRSRWLTVDGSTCIVCKERTNG